MAGFHRVTSSNPNTNLEPSYYAGTNAETFAGGQAVKLAATGLLTKATSAADILGYVETRDDIVGDGSTLIPVIVENGATWEVLQGALADAAVLPGLNVDLDAAATGITTDANSDFVVVQRDILPKDGFVWVKPTAWQIAF